MGFFVTGKLCDYSGTCHKFSKPMLFLRLTLLCLIIFTLKFIASITSSFIFAPVRPPRDPHWGVQMSLRTVSSNKTTYDAFVPIRENERVKPWRHITEIGDEEEIPQCVENQREWHHCDPEVCLPTLEMPEIWYPQTLKIRDETVATTYFVQQILEKAWGPDPPVIDLYLRTGCNGLEEILYLLHSVNLFWPLFLGQIILVLDRGDQLIVEYLKLFPDIPFLVVYEHAPCLPARVFNQVSYLKAYKYTTADYLVTIDSDCIFHAPVTPDYLFGDNKKLYFIVSNSFQVTDLFPVAWDKAQYQITGLKSVNRAHAMVTQPITVRPRTLQRFLNWIREERGRCYEDVVTAAVRGGFVQEFCWMCQLNVFLQYTPENIDYNYIVWNENPDPYLRFAAHVTYELMPGKNYGESVEAAINQGLCRWFGSQLFPASCQRYPTLDYVESLSRQYNWQAIALRSLARDFLEKEQHFQGRLDQVIDNLFFS